MRVFSEMVDNKGLFAAGFVRTGRFSIFSPCYFIWMKIALERVPMPHSANPSPRSKEFGLPPLAAQPCAKCSYLSGEQPAGFDRRAAVHDHGYAPVAGPRRVGEAPTTAIVRTPVRISRMVSSLRPSTGATSSAPAGLALLEECGHPLDGVRLGQIVDHRLGRQRIGHVERLFDLLVEGALADRQRRRRVNGDGPG